MTEVILGILLTLIIILCIILMLMLYGLSVLCDCLGEIIQAATKGFVNGKTGGSS